MDQDALVSATNLKMRLDKPSGKASFGGINLVFCVVCLVCAFTSVYNGWRENSLRDRVDFLERKVRDLQTITVGNVDVLMERIRTESLTHLKKRIVRDLYSRSDSYDEDDSIRATREAPECICPPALLGR
ncbi:unnamed protein product [Brassicogethes aeneus]|uniref:Uncharacterized protein n=1 Tax=Brassicogethes aeneus TaxID=1431903 RepID=A0A9P0BAU9_BRAAE|nr:unnamed protein product [Brassicogethes aeneus]